eukprot:CAMPEP_0204593850 /NCGR_PEP_ID=MMETSP0661-20131031/51743_1 /ASSEMBLY_ACC=CAM_ASM_000606 /TAXON_ID=109239 /ORGANISM="Alexandrium margalefi, Strain AMGDE01CS-322" /LENGTH=392 /DNA_ID=CAMNT_0051604197 /DNA_START=23 /DNA_END=1201 /DNA_ORIENTATION=+
MLRCSISSLRGAVVNRAKRCILSHKIEVVHWGRRLPYNEIRPLAFNRIREHRHYSHSAYEAFVQCAEDHLQSLPASACLFSELLRTEAVRKAADALPKRKKRLLGDSGKFRFYRNLNSATDDVIQLSCTDERIPDYLLLGVSAARRRRKEAEAQEEEASTGQRILSSTVPFTLVDTPTSLQEAFANIMASTVVAVDCEWQPGLETVSLMAVATLNQVYIIDVLELSYPEKEVMSRTIGNLFSAPSPAKLGFSFREDLRRLATTLPEAKEALLEPCLVMDLQVEFTHLYHGGNKDCSSGTLVGLSRLCEKELGHRLSKKLRRCDWNDRPLTENLLRYAALDSHCLLLLAGTTSRTGGTRLHEGALIRLLPGFDSDKAVDSLNDAYQHYDIGTL